MGCLAGRRAVFLVAAAFAGFVLVVALIALGAAPAVDLPVRQASAEHPSVLLLDIAFLFTQMGYAQGLVPVAVVATGLSAYYWRSPRAALPALVLGGSELANKGMKEIFLRPRPPYDQSALAAGWLDQYSFPSGHAMDSMALYSLLVCWVLASNWGGRGAAAALLALIPLLIGSSRVVLGVHWTTDVVGGWLAGLLVMSLVVILWQWMTGRWATRDWTRPRGRP